MVSRMLLDMHVLSFLCKVISMKAVFNFLVLQLTHNTRYQEPIALFATYSCRLLLAVTVDVWAEYDPD